MNSKSSKLLAAAVVALFCVSAVSIMFASDESSAASQEYNVYVEDIDADGIVLASGWITFTADSNDTLIENGTKALKAAGFEKASIAADPTYVVKIVYDDAAGGYNKTYYAKDGAWQEVTTAGTDYISNTTFSLLLNHGWASAAVYAALPASEQSKWTSTGYGGDYEYYKAPDVGVAVPEKKDYHAYLEIVKEDLSVEKSFWINFNAIKDPIALVQGANQALADQGIDNIKFSVSGGWLAVSYESDITTACYYVKDGKWTEVSDTAVQYVNSDAMAFAVWHGYISDEKYATLDDNAKKNWQESSMGPGAWHYMKVINESVTGYNSSGTNMMLYIGIGAIAILVIVAAAVAVMKKKSA